MAGNAALDTLKKSPILARTVPFLIFLLLTYAQGKFGEASRYWFYLAKTVAGAGMLWALAPTITELEWRPSVAAFTVGISVFVLWVGLDGLYPRLDELIRDYLCPLLKSVGLESWCPKVAAVERDWNPRAQFGSGFVGWFFIAIRLLGSCLVVPPLEEVFYRSFLYRYLAAVDFERIPLGKFLCYPFFATATIFGITHREWLAGILCGLIYQGLVCSKKRLGDAVMAHAITNLLLGVYVVWRGAWSFW